MHNVVLFSRSRKSGSSVVGGGGKCAAQWDVFSCRTDLVNRNRIQHGLSDPFVASVAGKGVERSNGSEGLFFRNGDERSESERLTQGREKKT